MSAEQTPTAMLRHTAVPLWRAIFLAFSVSGAAVVVSVLLGRPLLGLFGCVGLALGALNFVLMRRSLLRFSGNEHPTTKKQVAFSSLSRLFAITLVAVAFALLVRPDGIAVFAGLAIFQLVLGASSIVPVLKEWRKG